MGDEKGKKKRKVCNHILTVMNKYQHHHHRHHHNEFNIRWKSMLSFNNEKKRMKYCFRLKIELKFYQRLNCALLQIE